RAAGADGHSREAALIRHRVAGTLLPPPTRAALARARVQACLGEGRVGGREVTLSKDGCNRSSALVRDLPTPSPPGGGELSPARDRGPTLLIGGVDVDALPHAVEVIGIAAGEGVDRGTV